MGRVMLHKARLGGRAQDAEKASTSGKNRPYFLKLTEESQ